jgi:hypothetical protein
MAFPGHATIAVTLPLAAASTGTDAGVIPISGAREQQPPRPRRTDRTHLLDMRVIPPSWCLQQRPDLPLPDPSTTTCGVTVGHVAGAGGRADDSTFAEGKGVLTVLCAADVDDAGCCQQRPSIVSAVDLLTGGVTSRRFR